MAPVLSATCAALTIVAPGAAAFTALTIAAGRSPTAIGVEVPAHTLVANTNKTQIFENHDALFGHEVSMTVLLQQSCLTERLLFHCAYRECKDKAIRIPLCLLAVAAQGKRV